jgi:type IV secretion system protein VirB11
MTESVLAQLQRQPPELTKLVPKSSTPPAATSVPSAGVGGPAALRAPSVVARPNAAQSTSASKDEHIARLDTRLRWELGDTILKALDDDRVVEIMLNDDERVWVDVAGVGLIDTGTTLSTNQALSLIRSIAARSDDPAVTPDNPTFEGSLPEGIPGGGSRFAAVIPPIVERPIFAIRKRAKFVYTLDQYVEAGIMTRAAADYLTAAVRARKNILVVGGTGSGKTTLLNALLDIVARMAQDAQAAGEPDKNHRVIIIEDSARELQCNAPCRSSMLTSRHRDMQSLLRVAMRLRPDRVIIGETRGAEAWTYLKAMNSGHPGGASTIHANDLIGGLKKLESYILEAHVPIQRDQIADAIDVVVYIEKTEAAVGVPSTRRVSEIAEVIGVDERNEYILDFALGAVGAPKSTETDLQRADRFLRNQRPSAHRTESLGTGIARS